MAVFTEGSIGVGLAGRRRPITILTGDTDPEDLRELWARRVTVSWRTVTVSHPQREKRDVTYELLEVVPERAAEDQLEFTDQTRPGDEEMPTI